MFLLITTHGLQIKSLLQAPQKGKRLSSKKWTIHSTDQQKLEQYEVVKPYKPTQPKYMIDTKAAELRHTVIRQLPYHCLFNHIDMVWAKLKEYFLWGIWPETLPLTLEWISSHPWIRQTLPHHRISRRMFLPLWQCCCCIFAWWMLKLLVCIPRFKWVNSSVHLSRVTCVGNII